ncbi:hypothetical protein GC105_03045 [Alkalibaculum sp. M08DMB]|uniref:Flagellar protein FlgN n=1 Tax=Alkalibaculum sporogenes TaxID=2655001 RepID=A0A6A7K5P7_9FIRM|nr:hypothetical protein [Alkalibaculum sporogenes]
MIYSHEIVSLLISLRKLLQEEKQALLHNHGEKVAKLVEEKKDYIEKLAKYKGIGIESNKKAMALIEDINAVQETNLLLTEQAMSFQSLLLESIAQNLQNMSNTYSQNGKYNSENNINLLDQSV